jgi:type VI secretion system protein ImpB
MEDFDPNKIAEQIPALKELLDLRKKLDMALAKLSTSGELETLFEEVLSQSQKAQALASELGIAAEAPKPEGEK